MLRRPQDALLRLMVQLQMLPLRERGQTLGEYALLISLVAVGITVLALVAFRTTLIVGWDAMSACLNGSCGD